MATHSSVLAWRIPGTAGPGGLPSVGSHRVGHDWSDLAAAAAVPFRYQIRLVAQSCLTLCDPMNHTQHRPPCPSPTPGVHWDWRPSSQWCHPTISSSVFAFAFRYDLSQIPYDYTVEVRSRFKGLDLIDRVPEELWTEVRDIVQETGIKTIPMEKKCQKSKMAVWGGLKNSCKKRSGKQKRKGKI